MIVFKLKELIAKKERVEGRKYTLEQIALETGISRTTITRLCGSEYYSTNTAIIDRLCTYFVCELNDLLEYIPDQKQEKRLLTQRDAKNLKKEIHKNLVELIAKNINKIHIMPKYISIDKKILNNRIIDLYIEDTDGKQIFCEIRYILYFGIDVEIIKFCEELNADKIILFTFSDSLPADLREYTSNVEIIIYTIMATYNDFSEELIDIDFKQIFD